MPDLPAERKVAAMPNPGQPTTSPGATGSVVDDDTWSISPHASSATLESVVGLEFVIG
jgi:hypothetical protein